MNYPTARKEEVVDDYFGTKVADHYRWLEAENTEEVVHWLEEQNRITFGFVRSFPGRERIKARLTELWNFPRFSAPRKEGKRYFFSKNDGLQNQPVYYVQDSLDSSPQVVIDPNKLSADGTVALTLTSYAHDGALLAYGAAASGSDWIDIKIRKTDSGEEFSEVLKWCKFSNVAWKHDSSGFFYNRYPSDASPDQQYFHNRVYWHKLGTPQSEDILVYERQDAKDLGFIPFITEDGKYLCLHVWHGTDPTNRFYYREVVADSDFIRLLDENDAEYNFINNVGPLFYFATNLNAPRGRIIAIDIKNPGRSNWREILPEQSDVISSATMVNHRLVVVYLHDAWNKIRVFDEDGTAGKDIKMPTIGSVYEIAGKRESTEMFIGFTSFLYPPTIFRYDFNSGGLTVFRDSGLKFNPAEYETEQVFYRSKDGTRVPMFLTHRKGLPLDGNRPTLLYGYGGFNISMTPALSVSALTWIEKGGVYAVACMRGGGEYGEEWHRAGMLEKKQNVFDDFIAAAEWLIGNKYTNSKRLAISGGSNGGLLVGACMTQRPELYGAVICSVPVLDMLRYHKYTIGRYWGGEYGIADENAEHFAFLYNYSPLHNVKPGTSYPPTLICTGDHDDRVLPAHAKKFAAALQAAQSGDNPVLLRVEFSAGHGLGKPTSKIIEEQSDVHAFLYKVFGME